MTALFVPAGVRAKKVQCVVCGSRGYEGGKWQNSCRRGHAPCPACGKPLTLLTNGRPRRHARCPVIGRQ